MKLDPRRGAQVEAVLDNQALLFHALAFLLDGQLRGEGEAAALTFEPVERVERKNGGPVVSPS
jgi:hypothetical protein